MKAMLNMFVVVVVWVTAAAARAEDMVLVPALIPYEKDDTATDDIRKECDWNTTMPRYLAEKSDGRVKVVEQGFDAATAKKLTLVAINLHAIGGGGWTGPKWLVLEGKLMEGGKLLGKFEARRQTRSGSIKTCKTLTTLSEEISGDILDWLKTPSPSAKLGDAN